jgi:spermidine synthase
VVQACRAWFKLPPDDERLQVVVADAGVWISAPAQAASIDVLNIDLYDHQAAAPVLDSAEFYAACHAALRPGGFMTVNLFGRKASFARSAARISAAFGAPHCAMVSATAEGNTIAIARKADAGTPALPGLDDTSRADLAERAAQIQQLYKLPATRWLSLLAPLRAPAAGSTARKRPARSTEAVAAPAIATANEPAPVVASPRRSASKARA